MASNIPATTISKMRPRPWSDGAIDDYLTYLEYVLEQIQSQTGINQGELNGVPDVIGVVDPLSVLALQNSELEFIEVSSTYTTTGNQYVRSTSNSDVTLNPTPDDGEIVVFQPTVDNQSRLVGTIDGESQVIITRAYDAVQVKYSLEFGEWVKK